MGCFCPKCGSETNIKSKKRNLVICKWKHCKNVFSIFSFGILRDWKKGLKTFYLLVSYLFLKLLIRAISELLSFKYTNLKAFIKMMHVKAKEVFKQNTDKISGSGIIVEIDESKFGKRKYNKGHRVEGVWVVCLVERTPKRRILFFPVKN